MRYLVLFMVMFCTTSLYAELLPEVTNYVDMSSSDVNRIVCPEKVTDISFSKDKGVVAKIQGKNIFIKFLVHEQINPDGTKELIYTDTPSEFYVTCGGNVYTLIAQPKRIPAQTVRLSRGVIDKAEKNIDLFKGLPLEKRLIKLINIAYTDSIPESLTVIPVEQNIPFQRDVSLIFVRKIEVDGLGLVLKEYRATPLTLMGAKFSEKDFFSSRFSTRPLAIAVDPLTFISKGDTARIFIVEAKE